MREELLAIAKCCEISARMLHLADNHDPDPGRKQTCQKANRGQADLLLEAAQMARNLAAKLGDNQ